MTFSEIPLFDAVLAVFEEVENPGAEHWIQERRHEMCMQVLQVIVDHGGWGRDGIRVSPERIIAMWLSLRKQPKERLKVEVARTHGICCFMSHRGKGECAENVDLDRIIPGSRGGEYTLENCVLMCSYHNRQRGDRSIEEYLLKG